MKSELDDILEPFGLVVAVTVDIRKPKNRTVKRAARAIELSKIAQIQRHIHTKGNNVRNEHIVIVNNNISCCAVVR